ncbi:hypothetical protein BS637_13440 [Clostridium tepidum]|uniref:ABC transporter permease n=1 Tax=Clostridium tepidum TaxID=1962263 RepID=A0ABX3L062_9CLOT|nr:hypothetical protein BS637_13440 [Clostridium tepidum]
MLKILKRYIQIYKLNSYSLLSFKGIMIAILSGVLFYIQGINGTLNKANIFIISAFSIIIIMFSCDCITNELFVNDNKKLFKKENFYKKIIASNLTCLINIIIYILVLIIINIYFFNYNAVLKLSMQIITILILSTTIANFLLINNKNTLSVNITTKTGKDKYMAIIQFLKQSIISIVLGISLCYIYYNYTIPFLLLIALGLYILSLIINEKLYV